MKKLKTIWITAIMSMLTLPAVAQFTLDECQQLARENYPLLQKYDLIKQTAAYSIENINKGYLPQLSLSGQASYQSETTGLPDALKSMLANSGYKGMEKDQYRIALELNQVLWDGGNIKAQKKVASANEKIQAAQTDVAMYDVRNRVNELFFGILLLEEKLQLNTELQTLLQNSFRTLETQNAHGTAMKSDVNVIKAELLRAKQDRVALQSMRKSYLQMLAIFIGKEAESIDSLQKPVAVMPSVPKNQRPELLLYATQMQQTQAQNDLLKAALYPKLSFFAQGFYGYPYYDMFDSMFNHNLKLGGIIGVKLSWNIGKLYTFKNEKRQLQLAQKQIETSQEVFLFNNSLQAAQETEAAHQYREMMKADAEIIQLLTTVRQAAEAQLEHGVIDVNDLLREITKENQARINHSAHEIEMLKSIYELRNTINQ